MLHRFCNTPNAVKGKVQVEVAVGSHLVPNRWPWPHQWAWVGTSCHREPGEHSNPARAGATGHQTMCGYCRLNGSSAISKESQITVMIRPPSILITVSSGIDSSDGSFQG